MTPTRLARLGRQIVMQDERGEALVSEETIIRAAAQRCGISYEAVMGRSRLPEIVDARHEAIKDLDTLGCTPRQIAAAVELEYTTILFHLGRLSSKRYNRCRGWPDNGGRA